MNLFDNFNNFFSQLFYPSQAEPTRGPDPTLTILQNTRPDGGADFMARAFPNQIPEWAPWHLEFDWTPPAEREAKYQARMAAMAQTPTGGTSPTGGAGTGYIDPTIVDQTFYTSPGPGAGSPERASQRPFENPDGSLPGLIRSATGPNMTDRAQANFATELEFGKPGSNLEAIQTKSGARILVNARVAGNFAGFLQELEGTGYFIDPKNTGGFANRNKVGAPGISQHALGNAIDLNWNVNTDRSGGKHNLPDNIAEIAARHGLTWGGNWKRQDTMHFEYHSVHGVPMKSFGVGGKVTDATPSRPGSPLKVNLTAYSPMKTWDAMEGDYRAARKGPDGQAIVRTLEDVADGKSDYATLAGNPEFYNREYRIPKISFIDSQGRTRVVENVRAVVHDTGSAFDGRRGQKAPEGRFDLPAARDSKQYMNANHALWKKQGLEFIPIGK